jgi:hypothetical protein
MEAINAHKRRVASLARSARAALAVPSLFALALLGIRQPQMAGFAVFGTFAHLVLVNYDTVGSARFAQCALLTLLGAVMIGLGTVASNTVWLAVGGAVVVAVLSELPPLASGRVAAIRRALLLAFMLAVATPAPVRSVFFPYLAGWLMAGVVAQSALLLTWIPLKASSGAGEGESYPGSPVNGVAPPYRPNWAGNAVRSGLALGLAVLLTRILKVEHAFWVVLGVIPVLSAGAESTARTFWQEQAGTLTGFLVGALVVATIGSHQAWYWLLLPFLVFGSAYLASAVGLMAGQAAFTVFAIVLFCILAPQQSDAGTLRLEDIAIGGAVSLVVGSLLRLGDRGSVDRLPSAAKA